MLSQVVEPALKRLSQAEAWLRIGIDGGAKQWGGTIVGDSRQFAKVWFPPSKSPVRPMSDQSWHNQRGSDIGLGG